MHGKDWKPPPVIADFGLRLHQGPKAKPRVEKGADDAILTTLPGETIRWIKAHRDVDCKYKVPMSHYRERQLREMFKGLDFENKDEIDLEEFKNAVKYVQENIKNRATVFDNLQSIFEAMDEDGNGVVDFQEFTTACNGNGSSISKLSEYDFDRLKSKFVEYSTKKKRTFITSTLASNQLDLRYGVDDKKKDQFIPENRDSDIPRYRYLKSLLGINVQDSIEELSERTMDIEKKLNSREPPLPHAWWQEKVTKEYVAENLNSKETKTEEDVRYETLFKSLSQGRLDYLDSLKRDAESRMIEERIQEERDYIREGKKIEKMWQKPKPKASLPEDINKDLEFIATPLDNNAVGAGPPKSPSTNVKRDIEINRQISKFCFDKIRENSARAMTSTGSAVARSFSNLPILVNPSESRSPIHGNSSSSIMMRRSAQQQQQSIGGGGGSGTGASGMGRMRSKSHKDLKY